MGPGITLLIKLLKQEERDPVVGVHKLDSGEFREEI
jgi:hypothetical protein